MRIIIRHFVPIALAGAMLTGCASIPPEAPELSSELGNRISALEDTNLTLLHRFFDLKRAEVDRFIKEEWVPSFARAVFTDQRVAKVWDKIVLENDRQERLQFIVRIGPKLQAKINSKRLEFIQPLDAIERRIEEQLLGDYAEAKSINNALTSFLLSASKVAENRNRYLEMIGVTDEKIGAVLDQIDDVVTDLLAVGKDAQDKVERGKRFVEKLKAIRSSLYRAKE